MSAHDPTKEPTLAKLERGFKQFEEGLVIFEAKIRNGKIDISMADFWAAHALYRQLVLDTQAKKAGA